MKSRDIKIGLLVLLGIAHVIVTLFFVAPGHLIPDETMYHWMVRSFVTTGGFEIWNGYDELPSSALHNPLLVIRNGRLYPQYPALFQFVAYPFYRLAGYYGLFLLNSLAFVGIAALCFVAARRLFGELDLALNATLIFVLATYAWEYSQASWPHVSALFFIMAAWYAAVCAFFEDGRPAAWKYAVASGFFVGLGMGLRVDSILALPGIVIPFFFARPWRPREAGAVLVGAIPGITLLSVTNYLKFGTINFLSYGGGDMTPRTPMAPIALLGGCVILVAWVLTRGPVADRLRGHWMKVAAGALALIAVGLVAFPKVVGSVEQPLFNAYVCIVDIRSFDPFTPIGLRTAGGGVVHVGAQKKALLQSLPFLPILQLPLVRLVSRGRDFPQLALLLPVPLSFLLVYSYWFGEMHGGLCLNHRYLLPCLPMFSILAAYGIRDLTERWGKPLGWGLTLTLALCTAVIYHVIHQYWLTSLDAVELPQLTVPLAIASALFGLLAVGYFVRGPLGAAVGTAGRALLVVALAWAGLTALAYDYPHHRMARKLHHEYAERFKELVPSDSLFITDGKAFSASMELIEKDRVRIAYPGYYGVGDLRHLIDFHLKAGRPVLALFHEALWENYRTDTLSGYRITPVWNPKPFLLAKILPPAPLKGSH